MYQASFANNYSKLYKKAKKVAIICERIRTLSQGKNSSQGFGLKPDYLKSTGALIATIVDIAAEYSLSVYSVDTRSWMCQILGSAKSSNKQAAIRYVQLKGVELDYRTNKKGEIIYNDDAADSACIALYAFVDKSRRKVKLE